MRSWVAKLLFTAMPATTSTRQISSSKSNSNSYKGNACNSKWITMCKLTFSLVTRARATITSLRMAILCHKRDWSLTLTVIGAVKIRHGWVALPTIWLSSTTMPTIPRFISMRGKLQMLSYSTSIIRIRISLMIMEVLVFSTISSKWWCNRAHLLCPKSCPRREQEAQQELCSNSSVTTIKIILAWAILASLPARSAM